ncbi:ABC transporter substrate-binding protein [Agrobacterium sp. SOY23]|uniref:ABC transporter substrate-binding protein n=1 Tax=Agrobacterium sp. SOY23 TaxID=3014555 RepID=UPI0022B04AE4|nr:ABC transporter substrate-binding protein [Agrobacterium sp. SOY23]MCZ4431919.1 ABC transporter substrate-binding protein [Agrobacterium sp. SOY23]
MKARSIIVAISMAVGLMAGSVHAADKLKVALGTDGFVHLPLFVAYDGGLFQEEGLDVELVKFKGGGAAMSGLVGGSVEICSCSVQNAINATEKGAPVKLIGAMIDQYASNIVVTEEAAERIGLTPDMPMEKRLAALKGLRIAAAGAGGSADFLVRHLAGAAKLSPESDMSLLYMNDSGAMLASFDRNRIDGFALSSPTSDIAVLDHKGKLLIDMSAGQYEPLAGYPSIAISAQDKWLVDNRDKAVKFLRAITKADELIHNDPEKAKAAVRKRFEATSGPVFEAAWKSNASTYPKTPALTAQTVGRVIQFLGELQGAKIEGGPQKYFDNSYVEQAVAELKK